MKIVELVAENIKRIKAVHITPDGTLQVITGKNAVGKSSVLDSIWLALGGGQASRETPVPVREGEDFAQVRLDLGDLVVTRTWDVEKRKNELRVTAADGANYKRPQELLDGLVGKLSFDPLAFTRLSAKEQRQALLDLLDLDFEADDAERQRLYDLRTDTGRQMHAFGDLPKLPKDAPLTEKSVADLLDRIAEATQLEQRRHNLEHLQRERRARIDLIETRIAELRSQIHGLEEEAAGHRQAIIELAADAADLPAPADVEALSSELRAIEDHNKVVRENKRIAESREQQKALEEQYTGFTHAIAALDDKKARILSETTMPVDGLGFDEQGVTFRGIPFAQASSAEQIRVSLAMAMALNPELRVIRILDGSLLDSDSMAEIATMAKDADYQVWIERVEDDSESAIVIADGEVATQ